MKRIITLSTIAGIALLYSCKKGDSNQNKSDSPGKQLSALETKVVGKWQLVSSIDSNTDFTPARVTDALPECEKNDIYIFSADKTFTVNEGTTKCLLPGAAAGSWSVRAIQFDSTDMHSFEAEIVTCLCYNYPVLTFIDDTKMVLRGRDNSGRTFTVNTYRKL